MEIKSEYVIGIFVFMFSFLIFSALFDVSQITGMAATPKSQETTAELSVNRYINTAIDRVPVNFSFEGIVPGYWFNASNGTDNYGWPSHLIILPETNTAVNISYWGSDYFCRTSGSGLGCNVTYQNKFDVGNLTYNTSSTNFTIWPGDAFHHFATGKADYNITDAFNSTPVNDTNQLEIYDCTCPCGEHNYTVPIYYRLFVPSGVYTGDWQTNITFKVMDTGGG